MLLAQGRYWKITLTKGRDAVLIAPQREQLPDELHDLRDLRLEVPLGRWNALVKHAETDRKLLGGILLDTANAKEQVTRVVGSDRLLVELQRRLRDATLALIEAGVLTLTPASTEDS